MRISYVTETGSVYVIDTEEAEWVVSIGSRVIDAQETCTGCLGAACQAMYGAEGRPEATLRVLRIHETPR